MPKKIVTEQDAPQELALSVTEPSAAVSQYLSDLADSTRQWLAYAQAQVAEGNVEEASQALATISAQVSEYQQSTAAHQLVLQDSLQVVITQRDELVREVESVKEQLTWAEDSAFSEGLAAGEESAIDALYEDPSEYEDVVDQAREQNFHYLVGQLRRVGNESAAQLLESRYAQAKQDREELTRIESDARAWYFQLPVEARIGAPMLEHEDEVDNGLVYDEDEADQDEANS